MWRILSVSSLARNATRNADIDFRELQDPRPVIASLFGSNSASSLPPRILSLYLHNGVKIYASWLESLSENWEETHLDQIRSITSALESRLSTCAASSDIELQERAAEMGQLLELIRKGLDSPRPLASIDSQDSTGFGGDSADPYDESRGFASTSSSTTLLPPSCLQLLSPTFFSHELNPVNPKAQGMVTIPPGLDLDLVIIPRARKKEELNLSDDEDVDDFGRSLRKGKGRVDPGRYEEEPAKRKSKKGKGAKKLGETSEELAKVSNSSHSLILC